MAHPEDFTESEHEKLREAAKQINDMFLDAARKRSENIAAGRPVKPYTILAVGNTAQPVPPVPSAAKLHVHLPIDQLFDQFDDYRRGWSYLEDGEWKEIHGIFSGLQGTSTLLSSTMS